MIKENGIPINDQLINVSVDFYQTQYLDERIHTGRGPDSVTKPK